MFPLFLLHERNKRNRRKSCVEECKIRLYIALCFECRFNKNSLLQWYFFSVWRFDVATWCDLWLCMSQKNCLLLNCFVSIPINLFALQSPYFFPLRHTCVLAASTRHNFNVDMMYKRRTNHVVCVAVRIGCFMC